MTTPLPTSLPAPVPIGDTTPLAPLLQALAANSVLFLGKGVYSLPCDNVNNVVNLDDIRIAGIGPGITVIQRDPDPKYADNNQPVLRLNGDNITVENLTIDANAPDNNKDGSPSSNYAYHGLHIYGKGFRVSNVHIIRPTGNYSIGTECWGFFSPQAGNYPAGLVTDCVVSDVRGDYVEAFADMGGVTYRNCRYDAPVLTPADPVKIFYGFQSAGSSRVIDCVQNGGRGFFHTDTNSSKYLRISGCLGTNLLAEGVTVVVKDNETCDSLTVEDCTFELIPNVPGDHYGVGVSIPANTTNAAIRNVTVRDCKFLFAAGAIDPTVPGIRYAYVVANGLETTFRNNMIHPAFIDGVGATGTVVAVPAPGQPIP